MEIRIGDTVLWRGAFGQALERKAKVIGIERSGLQRDKYRVNSVRVKRVWSVRFG
jgi:hypothetical protein